MLPAPTAKLSDQHRYVRSSSLIGVVAASAMIVSLTWFSGGWQPYGSAGLDVTIVYCLAAFPLAAAVCLWLAGQNVSSSVGGLGAAGLAMTGWFAGLQPLEQPLLRLAAALSFAVGAVWLLGTPAGCLPWRLPRQPRGQWQTLAAVGCVMLAVVPWVYVQARCRHDVEQVTQMLEQGRIGEAYALSSRILVLAPAIKCDGRSLSDLRRELAAMVAQLQQRVAEPLPAIVSDEQWLMRVRDLAILGEQAAALNLMDADPVRANLPEACNLRGTLWETLHRWQPACDAYVAAKTAWEERPPSPQRAAGLVQALTGIAYAQRKLGRYHDAEAAYQQRLELAPTAESHFLLAQFYEDTQRWTLARRHVSQAMALEPEQYRQTGEQLLRKLATFHFGCFQN